MIYFSSNHRCTLQYHWTIFELSHNTNAWIISPLRTVSTLYIHWECIDMVDFDKKQNMWAHINAAIYNMLHMFRSLQPIESMQFHSVSEKQRKRIHVWRTSSASRVTVLLPNNHKRYQFREFAQVSRCSFSFRADDSNINNIMVMTLYFSVPVQLTDLMHRCGD